MNLVKQKEEKMVMEVQVVDLNHKDLLKESIKDSINENKELIKDIDLDKLNLLSYKKEGNNIRRIYGSSKSMIASKYLVIQNEDIVTTDVYTTIYNNCFCRRYKKSN